MRRRIENVEREARQQAQIGLLHCRTESREVVGIVRKSKRMEGEKERDGRTNLSRPEMGRKVLGQEQRFESNIVDALGEGFSVKDSLPQSVCDVSELLSGPKAVCLMRDELATRVDFRCSFRWNTTKYTISPSMSSAVGCDCLDALAHQNRDFVDFAPLSLFSHRFSSVFAPNITLRPC